MKHFILIFLFSFLLLSCKKEEVKPSLTKEQWQRLVVLQHENPDTPYDVLINIVLLEDYADNNLYH